MNIYKDFDPKLAVKNPGKITNFILNFLPKHIVREDDFEFTFKKWRGVHYLVNVKDKRSWQKRIAEHGWSFNNREFLYELRSGNKVIYQITVEMIELAVSKSAVFYEIYKRLGYSSDGAARKVKEMLEDRV
jgi:hypothetical protein